MFTTYEEARAEAQRLANEAARQVPALAQRGACDWRLEHNPLTKRWTIGRLPQPENRYGFELRCEVVMPEINRFPQSTGATEMKGQAVVFSGAHTQRDRDNGSTDNWGTPRAFFDLLDAEFHFTLDPCADESNAKCAYFDEADDGLAQEWGENVCFVNFPYSGAKAWAKKIVEAAEGGATVVVLCAARTDTEWWQSIVSRSSEVRFVKGRLRFVPPGDRELKGESAGFPSSVIVLLPQCLQGDTGTFLTLWDVPLDQRR